jgi:single-stranded-DNA-specific exonuclease
MEPRWTLRPVDDESLVQQLARELNDLPEPLARLLVARGVHSFEAARAFFRAGLEDVHDPFLMADMDRAAERLTEAITGGETVMVYGDYDVDGTTATAVMTDFLRRQGVDVSFFIPSRFEHGYGLCNEGLDEARRRGAALVVALDCGITAVDEARYARELGLDLIIADHHEPGAELPGAVAVLDPKRPDCAYPFKGLSGCGVGYKLIQATLQLLGRPAEEAHPYLDLLAVSIAADIVPVLGENRVLMRAGLEVLSRTPRLGLRALAEVAGRPLEQINGGGIVFGLGPRINAAGRLGSADRAAHLFLTEDPAEARALAAELEEVNKRRRDLDMITRNQAITQGEALMAEDPFALVLHQDDWHPGVIGIVAARVAEHFSRPAILLTGAGPVIKGSARSVGAISIFDALGACGDHLIQFGGHDAAAGLSLERTALDGFREALNAAIGETVELADLQPEIALDAVVDLRALNGGLRSRFWSVLKQVGPFGPDNPKPVFWGRDLRLAGEPRVVGTQHLKMSVRQGEGGPAMPVIGFGLGERLPLVRHSLRAGVPLELAFSVTENHWNGNIELQLEAKDVRLPEGAELPVVSETNDLGLPF